MAEQSSVRRIVRASHDTENPYFLMLRATAQNTTLSYEARGLIAYLLSKPDDWEVMIEDLCQECGRGRVYRIIKDLLDAKYLERIYHRDELGKIVYVEYVVHEKPFLENPKMAKPKVGKPKVENRTLHNTDKTHKKDKEQKKDIGGLPLTPQVLMKNAIHKAFGYDEKTTTGAMWSLIGKAASELLKAQATPDDIPALHKYCAQHFDNFKAMALVTNWEEFQKTRTTPNGKPRISANQQILIQQRADELGIPYELLEADYLEAWNK